MLTLCQTKSKLKTMLMVLAIQRYWHKFCVITRQNETFHIYYCVKHHKAKQKNVCFRSHVKKI